MNALIIPWSKHHEMVVAEPGPWIGKDFTPGVLTYCPVCRAVPQPKFGNDEIGTIKCGCHETTAELRERDSFISNTDDYEA
jgi:hypothetical protein